MPLTKAKTMTDLLHNKLMALYDVEIQITKAVPKMIKKAQTPEVHKGLTDHLEETQGHVKRLEKCFQLLGLKPKKLKSEAIRGLVEDAAWVLKNVETGPALDANIIAAAQYVEHYEIAGYMSAIEWATVLQEDGVVDLLRQTLKEEENAGTLLSQAAKDKVDSQVPID